MVKKAHRVGPYSLVGTRAKLDQRTQQAQRMRATIAELTAHVGGDPSPTQRRLIERAAWLEMQIDAMDARAMEGDALTERDSRSYLAWCNTYRRTLVELGLKGFAAGPRSATAIAAGARE